MKEQLKAMKESLMACAQAQMGNLEQVDAKELGEVIDMVKDLEEALYYCAITESMEESKKEDELLAKVDRVDASRFYNDSRYMRPMRRGYSGYPEMYDPNNDFNRNHWRLNGSSERRTSDMNTRSNMESPYERSKRGYSDWKNSHKEDKTSNMANLEEYLKQLSEDVTELMGQMDANEKMTVKNKLTTLASKIA